MTKKIIKIIPVTNEISIELSTDDDDEESISREPLIENTFRKYKDGLLLENYELITQLKKKGKLDEAESLLRRAIPYPAVLYELRKIITIRALEAKKQQNWQKIIDLYLEYIAYVKRSAKYLKQVNASAPGVTPRDTKLFDEAMEKVKDNKK